MGKKRLDGGDGSSSEVEADDGVRAKKPKNIIEANRNHIERLMARIEKPVHIPPSKRDKLANPNPKGPKDYIRNVQGSSAGAGSGEFHVYRALRRKEFARQKHMDMKAKQEAEAKEYEEYREHLKRLDEERTAKKRAKRRNRKRGGGAQKHSDEDGDASSVEGEGEGRIDGEDSLSANPTEFPSAEAAEGGAPATE
ncbi:hypothetical protein DFJ73DRAFT_836832 [Zopfochytrium polystomum]|nr:hypothetical protein DFJ73DRAFT_836832 [Zopfochytrium polystomum]